jgi:transposase
MVQVAACEEALNHLGLDRPVDEAGRIEFFAVSPNTLRKTGRIDLRRARLRQSQPTTPCSNQSRNEMKNISQILALAMLMMFASPMVAAQNESSADEPMAEQMEKMHSHMQTMQQQMKEIKAAKNTERRKALMQQHMQSMREGMMMGEMGDAQGKMSHTAMQEKNERMSCQQDDAQC